MYPVEHVGWHVLPLARVLVQSPTLPLTGAVAALQVVIASGMHVADVNTPVGLHVVAAER